MISICVTTYNGEKYIRQQLDSILTQLQPDDEIIVSDDGSTDDTLSIVESYVDLRIKIFHNTERHGVCGNFENALRQVSGEYVFLSDQDDVWLPGKVEACVRALSSADLVIHDCVVTDGDLNVIAPSFFAKRHSGKGFMKNLIRNSYVGACVAFRASLLALILPIPRNLPVYHDGWIASLADISGEVVFIDFKGIYFRRHEHNASFTAGKSGLSLYEQIRYRILLTWLIIKRYCKYG